MGALQHTIKYSALVTDDSANLLAYDMTRGEFQLLGIVNITFGCSVGDCRHYTTRKEIRFRSFGNASIWTSGC